MSFLKCSTTPSAPATANERNRKALQKEPTGIEFKAVDEYSLKELEYIDKLSKTSLMYVKRSPDHGHRNAFLNLCSKYARPYIAIKNGEFVGYLSAYADNQFTWTVIETVSELVPYENIFFDFAAICESPSIIGIFNQIGTSRCIRGSDYNVSMDLGKAIALGDSFYWINERNLLEFNKSADIHPRHIITENLMAVREAAIISSISKKDVEDMFYNNACQIFA